MYLSADRLALANQEVRETFEQTSVAWQAIPHWDTGDPGQTQVRSDIAEAWVPPPNPPQPPATPTPGPFGSSPLPIKQFTVSFDVTLAQAISPRPDALLAALIPRTAQLARQVDDFVVAALFNAAKPTPTNVAATQSVATLLTNLIDARVAAENFGYRAPSCLITSTRGLQRLSQFDGGYSVLKGLLEAANINSLYRIEKPAALGGGVDPENKMILLGRRQRIPQGGAPSASPGEEPVDLAVSVPPSLEIIGETAAGNIATGDIALAVRVSLVPRIKHTYGVVGVDF